MLQHVLAGCLRERGQRGFAAVDQFYSRHEVFQRTGVIEEAVLAVQDKFRNASDRGGKHGLAANHGFHQHQRNTLAAARKDNEIGCGVADVKLLA